MKRFFSFLISALLLVFSCVCISAEEGIPEVGAKAYVLYCPDNEQVMLSGNMNTSMGMASTTKIMTALLGLEHAQRDNRVVEFTSNMTAEGSSMYLKVGDKVYLSDLVAGMMTVSGNDAANAVAVAVGGDIETFVELMNKRAEEIGMKNTRFVNPSGLPDENHYSSAYDMALLMSKALENEEFCNMTAKKNIQVDFVNPPSQRVTYTNHNKLLWKYKYCDGGKTGYTLSDGRCLVTCATKDNLRLIAVTLSDSRDWNDHTSLYEYGFAKYAAVLPFRAQRFYAVRVISSEKESVRVEPRAKNKLVVKKEDALKLSTEVYVTPIAFAPVYSGQTLGRIVCTFDGKAIYEEDLVSVQSAEYMESSGLLRFFRRLFRID